MKLGHEECEMCLEFENHSCSIDEVSEEILSGIIKEIECNLNQKTNVSNNVKKDKKYGVNCGVCDIHKKHIVAANQSRVAYSEDKEKVNNHVFSFSVDLQKVIMIPRLPGVKSVVYQR